MTKLVDACAHGLMDIAPQIVQAIRVEMRHARDLNISVPQFRTLRFIQRNPDSSLSNLAEYLGAYPALCFQAGGWTSETKTDHQKGLNH